MEKYLSDFAVGETGKIKSVAGEGRIRRRLFDMGVTAGATVTLRKKAPLGDPVELNIRGYELSLRKAEAACVLTEVEK
ncbi:MAG: ferrous iron transport protein A [Bacillota bacterium]|nr:MAG: ferrous iron transport protein A [Bacillota bacterium]